MLTHLTRTPADYAPNYTLYIETTTTQLRSDSCFADRLVILNDDLILSEDQKKGLCRNS